MVSCKPRRLATPLPKLIAASEFQNIFPPNIDARSALLGDTAGFIFEGNLGGEVQQYAQAYNSTTWFLPVDGDAFVTLSEDAKYAPLLHHPIINPFSFSPTGLDFNCVSQLNISVANTWKGNWMGKNPK